MSKKDADRLVKDLARHFAAAGTGYTVEKRGGHLHVVNAEGKSIHWFGSTPSDSRFRQNTTAALRRKGIVPPGFR